MNCSPQLGKSPVEKVVRDMTLDEKVRTVVGTFTDVATPPPVAPGVNNRADYPGSGENTALSRNQVPGAAGDGYPVERLGIPAIVYADGPAGLRIDPRREGDPATYFCTAFPGGTLLSATWDPAVVEKVGEAIGDEVLRYGVDVLLAPGMNLQRNPLTGRNFEYYSEDPLLSGLTAAAYVKGVQSQGVGTSVKHFAANNQETNRYGSNSQVSERALREIYLRGFEIAVRESQPHALMTSYNLLNGIHTSEHRGLIEDVLRAEFGFRGVVMTDWIVGILNAGKKKYPAPDPAKIAAAGGDLVMPGSAGDLKAMLSGLRKGTVTRHQLEVNATRVLRLARLLSEKK